LVVQEFHAKSHGEEGTKAVLRGAISREANLQEASLRGANLSQANLKEAVLALRRNLTIEQLSEAKTLHMARLDPELEEQVKEKCPHLLEESKPEE